MNVKRARAVCRRVAAALAVGLFAVMSTTTASFAQHTNGRLDNELNLAVGETKTISAREVKNYSEGVPGIVDVRLTSDSQQFVIAGKRPGTTTLLLIKNDGSQFTYDITVSTRSPAVVEKELGQLLEGIPGIRVRRVGARLFIEGGVASDVEARRIQQLTTLYPGQVESLVTVGQGAADRKILIRLDFFFVQYDKSSSYAVGLGWPQSIGGAQSVGGDVFQTNLTYDFVAKTATTAQASVVNQPLPRLDIGAKHGWVKILKQSTVLTANGAEAVFDSGGEQNFVVSSGLGGQLVRLIFGANITVLPRYELNTKDVELKLVADLADLTPPASNTILPGRTITKLNTSINLKLGQALVLSGVRQQTHQHDVTGLPGLSEIPVLGVLFGSHRDDVLDVENAIFVIPSVVETAPRSAIEMIKNALSTYSDYSGELDQVNLFNKTPPSAK